MLKPLVTNLCLRQTIDTSNKCDAAVHHDCTVTVHWLYTHVTPSLAVTVLYEHAGPNRGSMLNMYE